MNTHRRPRLLDLFCGAGGAARGYQLAGFDVTGVDHRKQPRYAGDRFIQADALEFLADADLTRYDAIHASPPCQRFTALAGLYRPAAAVHPDLLTPTLALLARTGVPWVVENVPGAPLRADIMLCGEMFGLKVRRHRWFQTSPMLYQLMPPCRHDTSPVGVYGHPGGTSGRDYRRSRGDVSYSRRAQLADWKTAMGIDWMTAAELAQGHPTRLHPRDRRTTPHRHGHTMTDPTTTKPNKPLLGAIGSGDKGPPPTRDGAGGEARTFGSTASEGAGMPNPNDPGPSIHALPVTYRSVRFRSSLEADWAATFDAWGWFWLPEPIAVRVGNNGYLIDFELPHQRVWCEVKGPHNIGIQKTYAVAEHFGANQGAEGPEGDPYDLRRPLIVILEASSLGARWRAARPDQHIVIANCGECGQSAFMDYNGIWACRYGCRNNGQNKFWRQPGSLGYFESGEPSFVRSWTGP